MNDKESKSAPWWRAPLLFYSKLNGWIIGPFLIAFLFGRWLDGKFGWEPWGTVALISLAFILSIAEMVKVAKEELRGKK